MITLSARLLTMKILLVEDDKKTAFLLGKGLNKEGFMVDLAYSAEEAEHRIRSGQYELLILDWMLPDNTGLSLCWKWREQGMITPILMLTARDSTQDRIDGLNTGADDYLIKPFAFDELLARIRALIRRSELTRVVELSYADLKLDAFKHKAWRSGVEINLTRKESAMLELFMRYPGDTISRAHFAEHIWHANLISINNLIDSHMRNLRRKIDFPGVVPLIQTVRGEGFSLALFNKNHEND